jgi:hypothetical protein
MPTGWTTTGEFTAVQYGASGGFPDKTSPGPITATRFEGTYNDAYSDDVSLVLEKGAAK